MCTYNKYTRKMRRVEEEEAEAEEEVVRRKRKRSKILFDVGCEKKN